jgi:NitT/TauT family transport system permease protein
MAKSFEAPKGFIIKKVIFYDVLPTIFSSLKIASGRAVIGMVVAEFLGIGKGVGYLISFYSATLQTNKMLAVLIVVLMINFVLTSLIDFAKMKTIRWP